MTRVKEDLNIVQVWIVVILNRACHTSPENVKIVKSFRLRAPTGRPMSRARDVTWKNLIGLALILLLSVSAVLKNSYRDSLQQRWKRLSLTELLRNVFHRRLFFHPLDESWCYSVMCDCTTKTDERVVAELCQNCWPFDIRIICCKQNNTACMLKQLHVPFLSPSTSAVLTTPPWISWNFRLFITMTAISSASQSTATSYKTIKSFIYSKPKTCTCILIKCTLWKKKYLCERITV